MNPRIEEWEDMPVKKFLALWLAVLMFVSAPALAEEGFVEPAGDGSDFSDTPEGLITSAMEVYSWFVMWPLDVDENLPGGDGDVYAVLDERLFLKEDMDNLLSSYFSPEICQALWDWELYTVIDGGLYAPLEGDWRWIDERIREVSYRLAEETDNRREYEVVVYYEDDGDDMTPEEERLAFVQEKTPEGWQFTQFPFFW